MITRDQLLDDVSIRLQLLQAIFDVVEECERLPLNLLHEVAWSAFRQMPQAADHEFYSKSIRSLIALRLRYEEAGKPCE